ncbi:uncharacterized protein BJ212DRAFT_1482076 [Suillus subaureus]|uniref:Uncharacterized protein n=1 Tax=Suillus subaureus TaxID=48587 RepID=A0A9P7E8C4_9AGAM|nr:uncharacterized protein BJ212DRAFT_1482076 [Suillus subaureus]KAG1814332.1 hypothetical protein BJ212DRAFT_1482076 [Suillus subaureus]
MDNYSQWYNYHIKKRASKHIIKAKSEDTPISTTRKRSSSETEDSDDIQHTTTLKRSCVDSNIDELDASPPSSSEQILLLASPTSPSCHDTPLNCEPTPPPRTDKGKEKEVIMVEVIDPLSNLVLKPRPKPIQKKITTPPVDTSMSEINSNPAPLIDAPLVDTPLIDAPLVISRMPDIDPIIFPRFPDPISNSFLDPLSCPPYAHSVQQDIWTLPPLGFQTTSTTSHISVLFLPCLPDPQISGPFPPSVQDPAPIPI